MKRKVTFYIMSHAGARSFEFALSRNVLRFLFFIFLSFIIAFFWILYDYSRLFFLASEIPLLNSEISEKKEDLELQRKQIQVFAKEINLLKNRLLSLVEFEQKIRIIANLQPKDEGKDIFGLGGPLVENLESDIEFSESHAGLIREMHDRIALLEEASYDRVDSFDSLFRSLELQRNILATTPAIRPALGWLSSRFGYRTSPFTGKKAFHSGLDIANNIGTPIVATADGVVSFIGKRGAIGLVVNIDHGHGFVTRYGHLSKALVKLGQKVKRGEIIAEMGNSGRSTGPHVHYEVRLNGVAVNPAEYILD